MRLTGLGWMSLDVAPTYNNSMSISQRNVDPSEGHTVLHGTSQSHTTNTF